MIELAVQECTFHLSESWPSPGLQIGEADIFYARLAGRNSTAERVGLACPNEEWSALAAARVASGTWETGVTGPCGTATVSSGQQLIDALQQLQPSNAAVLLTLANNISLPANPTPQRTPTSTDDANPLVTIYRRVTLAGIGGGSASFVAASSSGGTNSSGTPAPAASRTELNLRLRRNSFDLVAAGQQQQPGRKPFMALADVILVNAPPGAPSSWPIGLIGNAQWYMGLNRSGTAGLQAVALRSLQTYDFGKIGYLTYTRSLAAASTANGSAVEPWLADVIPVLDQVSTQEGTSILRATISDFMVTYNSGFSRIPLLTPSAQLDYDLWSLPPLLVPAPALPPNHFAVARGAAQLLALMQEPWTRGQRVIMLVENVTLTAAEWPAAGAALTYNLTLTGPATEPPIWLDTAGLPLVRSAVAPAQSSNMTAAGAAGNVTLQLLRLRLVGLAPPLLVVSPQDLAQADAEGLMRGGGTPALGAWRDRCIAHHAADTAALLASGLRTVRHQIINCTLELPAGTLDLLNLVNVPEACAAEAARDAVACGLVTGSSNGSVGAPNAGAMSALLARSLVVSGQASFAASLPPASAAAAATAPPITFITATLSGVPLTGSRAILLTAAAAASSSSSAIAAAGTAASNTPCHIVALAAAIIAPPPSPPPNGDGSSDGGAAPVGAIVGGVVGGVAALALCAAAAAVFMLRRRRRRQAAAALPAKGEERMPSGVALSGPKTPEEGQQVAPDFNSKAITIAPPSMETEGAVKLELDNGADGVHLSSPAPSSLATASEAAVLAAPPAAAAAAAAAVVTLATGVASAVMPNDSDSWTLSFGGDKAGTIPALMMGRTMADELVDEHAPVPGGGLLGSGARGVHGGSNGSQPGTPQAASASAHGLTTTAGRQLRSRVAEEIGALIMRTKATVAAADSQASKSGRGRGGLKVLGRGAYGVVYLGAWRGLPAAIKIMTIQSDDSDRRREQLAREVALTTTLSSPYIVPTYCFSLHAAKDGEGPQQIQQHKRLVLVSSGGRMDGGASEELDLAGGAEEEEEASTALRLRLAMQYCEGGSLKDALRMGKFRSPAAAAGAGLPPSLPMTAEGGTATAPNSAATGTGTGAGTEGSGVATGSGSVAQEGSCGRGLSGGAPSTTADAPAAAAGGGGGAAAATAGEQQQLTHGQRATARLPRRISRDGGGLGGEGTAGTEMSGAATTSSGTTASTSQGVDSATAAAVAAASAAAAAAAPAAAAPSATAAPQQQLLPQKKRLEWEDVIAAPNLPLSLLAALDILRGLAYLHSRGVVHGDLTDNNILLKSVLPVLPLTPRSRPQSQSLPPPPTDSTASVPRESQQGVQGQHIGAASAAGASQQQPQLGAAVAGAGHDGGSERPSPPLYELAGRALAAPQVPTPSQAVEEAQKREQQHPQQLQQQPSQDVGGSSRADCSAAPTSQWTNDMRSTGSNNSGFQSAAAAAVLSLYGGGGSGSSFHAAGSSTLWSALPQNKQQALAMRLLRTTFKIADFGLSIQLHGASQTHLSNMGQGTPFFAAPEVVAYGRLSPAADIYGFGVVFFLLLHGVCLGDIRHLLPFLAFTSIAPLLLSRTSPSLPPAAHRILSGCLAMQAEERPAALELVTRVEELLQEVVGPELARLLLGAERREHVTDK